MQTQIHASQFIQFRCSKMRFKKMRWWRSKYVIGSNYRLFNDVRPLRTGYMDCLSSSFQKSIFVNFSDKWFFSKLSIGKGPELSILTRSFSKEKWQETNKHEVYIGKWNKTEGKVKTHLEIDWQITVKQQ